MAYNPIKMMLEGDITFLTERWDTSSHGESELIERIRNHPQRKEILTASLTKILKCDPYFAFEIIYDMEEYRDIFYKLIGKLHIDFNSKRWLNILNNTQFGEEYIYNNFNNFIEDDIYLKMDNLVEFLFKFSLMKEKWLDFFLKSQDMLLRGFFFISLVKIFPSTAKLLINENFNLLEWEPQIGDQLMVINPQISMEHLSLFSSLYLKRTQDKQGFIRLKNYILKNYKKNDLARHLLAFDAIKTGDSSVINLKNNLANETLKENINELFVTSKNDKLFIYQKFRELINKDLMDLYANIINIEKSYPKMIMPSDRNLAHIYTFNLGENVEMLVDKYLSLSISKEIEFLDKGSCSSTYKIGDYIIKFGTGKHSTEKTICPNIYLIVKNLEEFFVRDEHGRVVANLEVQKYLSKKSTHLDESYFVKFSQELSKLGYWSAEYRSREGFGENFGILDSYKEADCANPEVLPDWFKECPLVLWDRDLIYSNGLIKKAKQYKNWN